MSQPSVAATQLSQPSELSAHTSIAESNEHWSQAVPAQWLAVSVTAGVQTPARQASPVVQTLPSLQFVPSVAAGFEHRPVAGAQTPGTWHWSDALQTLATVPTQTPAWQMSMAVQRLLSLQGVLSATGGFVQTPVGAAQTPATWHWSSAVQVFCAPPVQTPARQVSDSVHPLPSSQAIPSAATGAEHAPLVGSHTPAT